MSRSILAAVTTGLLVLSAPLVLDGTAPESAPPTSEPEESDEAAEAGAPADAPLPAPGAQRDPEGEREVVEFAFGWYLSGEFQFETGSFSCTAPLLLDIGETITCFALVDDERVIVAVTEIPEIEGAYQFEVVSDHPVRSGGAISATTAATSTTVPDSTTTSGPSTTALPEPILVTTAPLSESDRELLDYGEQQVNENSQAYIDTNISSSGGTILAINEYAWNPASATVTLDVTLSPDFGNSPDVAAWVAARERAMFLWHRDAPFRLPDATIKPSLVIVVNGNRYVSDFDLCVQVADQTISMNDWLSEARES